MFRLRVTFAKGEEIKYISHLDLMRAWERALRRAQVPLAYSKGFNPHPRLSIAAPLAVGLMSKAELMDVFLEKEIQPERFDVLVTPHLPAGLRIISVSTVPLDEPSLQARVVAAEYTVELALSPLRGEADDRIARRIAATEPLVQSAGVTAIESLTADEIKSRIAAFLAAQRTSPEQRVELAAENARYQGKRKNACDLLRLVYDVWLEDEKVARQDQDGGRRLTLRLRLGAGQEGTARPEQVLDALGLRHNVVSITRTTLEIVN